MGEGRGAAEQALEAILARVPALGRRGPALPRPSPAASATPTGGSRRAPARTSSSRCRGAAPRCSSRGTPPTRRAGGREACGFGVAVLDYLPEEGVEIFAFLETFRASSNLDFLRPVVRHNAVQALRAFNDSPRPDPDQDDLRHDRGARPRRSAEVGGRVPQDRRLPDAALPPRPRRRSWPPASTSCPA